MSNPKSVKKNIRLIKIKSPNFKVYYNYKMKNNLKNWWKLFVINLLINWCYPLLIIMSKSIWNFFLTKLQLQLISINICKIVKQLNNFKKGSNRINSRFNRIHTYIYWCFTEWVKLRKNINLKHIIWIFNLNIYIFAFFINVYKKQQYMCIFYWMLESISALKSINLYL